MPRRITTKQRRYRRRFRTKKVKSGGDSVSSCWAKIFDIFAARYGINNPDDFYEHYTLRQVTTLLKTIDDAKHEDVAMQAELHGLKIKPRIKALKLSKEEREAADQEAQSLLDRMEKEYEAKKWHLKN